MCSYYVWIFAFILVFIPLFQGCSSGTLRSEPSPVAAATGPTRTTVRADWSDLEAAMEVAAPRAELAILSTTIGPTLIRFEVLAATDEAGEVLATRLPPTDSLPTNTHGENIEISLTARIGRFGDTSREIAILDALSKRLSQLHAKATAPLDWD